MNKNYILNCFAVAAFALVNTMGAMAAPLLKGTKLSITQGETISAEVPCTIGSCFGIEYSPGLYIWQSISPGTDGGFIAGKAQKCETAPPGILPYIIPGELTSTFQFHGGYIASFCTDPGGELNLFDDAKCSKAGCLGKTELRNFYVADLVGNNKSSLSNNAEVLDYLIDPVTDGIWGMDYRSMISAGPGQKLVFVC